MPSYTYSNVANMYGCHKVAFKPPGHGSNFELISYCGCPGYTLSYKCAVAGSDHLGTTVWSGSAFDCSGGEINLLHRFYNGTESDTGVRAYGECNNSSIVAQGVRVENGTYISQLNISVSNDMIGRSIECFDATADSALVDSAIISRTGIKVFKDMPEYPSLGYDLYIYQLSHY